MENKAFELIAGRVEKVLSQQHFERQKEIVRDEEGAESVLFIGETMVYSVTFTPVGNRFELKNTAMTDEGPDDTHWKSISNWIFDPELDTMRDAENIASDFANTLDDSKRRAAVRAAKRKISKDQNDDCPGPVFFYKRLVAIFPELKEEIAEETEAYEDFRAVTFGKNVIVPKIDAAAKKNNPNVVKKLSAMLQDFYNTGDMDVRSIISMVIFNGVSEEARKNLMEGMSDEFKKYYVRVLPYQHRNVRPEAPKKARRQSRLTSTGGSTQYNERLSGNIPKNYR